MGERFLRKKPKKLRFHRVSNADKRDNLRRSFCEVSPIKLRLHPVADADKWDKNYEKVKEQTALKASTAPKKLTK